MTISIDWDTYLQYQLFFDSLADAMIKNKNRVGIITGDREKFTDIAGNVVNSREIINSKIGFKPDFVHMWGETETIANGALWKAQKMDLENVLVHFDDDARDIKLYTDRWVMKAMLNGQEAKF